MVQDAFDQEHSDRLRELSSRRSCCKRITPDEAGAGGRARDRRARAADLRAAWWRYVSALRGHHQPAARPAPGAATQDPTAVTREIESAADEQGAAAVSKAQR